MAASKDPSKLELHTGRGIEEFSLKPHILYLNESRKFKMCKPESSMASVKELGISDGFRGERWST
jgi:hypothetical protein